MQVAEAFHAYGKGMGARVVPVYGGQPIGQQLRGLRRGVDVVVATPGRAVDHLKRGSLSFEEVGFVVLDEADEMLDMGFAEDLDTILSATPPERQTALFSATISPTISRIAKRHLREPARISVKAERPAGDGAALVRQTAYVVRRVDKLAALCRILDVEDPTSALVFARTRGEVDDLAESLSSRGHDAGALHGGLAQEARDRMMGRFRDGSLDVLVATDVAARGLDIDHVSHVVNYDVPSDPDAYVHRIGRTGRAGREGVAITLVEPREHRLLRNIETATRSKLEIARLPTVADLRDRRLELLRSNLREALVDGRPRSTARRRRAVDRGVRRRRYRPRRRQPDRGRRDATEDQVELAQAFLQPPSGAPGTGWTARGGPRGPGGPGDRPAARDRRSGNRVARGHPVTRDRRGSHAARSPKPGRSSGSVVAVGPACGRATSSGRSPTRPGSRGRSSGRSSCSTISRSSTCRRRSPTPSPTRCAAPRSVVRSCRSVASVADRRRPHCNANAGIGAATGGRTQSVGWSNPQVPSTRPTETPT